MTDARRPFPTDKLRAFVASGRLWLVELLAWLAGVLGVERAVARALRRELDDLHRAVALLVFAEARSALILPSGVLRSRRPSGPPRGFACARENSEMRLLWRSVPRGLGLRARILALAKAIDSIGPLAARFVRRLRRPYAPALILRRIAAEALRPRAHVAAVELDTS